MKRITYLVGRTVDDKQRSLIQKMVSHENDSFLHLVSTRGRVMELEVDPQFWLPRRVDTLTRIIYQIFEEHIRYDRFNDHRPIDDALKSLLIKKVLERRRIQPDGLAYFSRLLTSRDQELDFPGIYGIISEFFSLLVRNNFQDFFVEELAGRIIRLEEKIPGMGEWRFALESDLTWLFGDYEEIKREIRGYDDEDVLSSVRSYLSDGGTPHILDKTDILIFDGFIHMSRIEEDILFYFFHGVQEVWWSLDYDSQSENAIEDFKDSAGREARWHWKDKGSKGLEHLGRHEAYRIFTPFVSLIQRLEEAGFDFIIERAIEEAFPNPVAGGLYFHGDLDQSPRDSLKIRSFANRVEEVRAVAGEIKRIIHERKLDVSRDLGKFRVIFPDLNDYSSLIFEIFSEHNLPFSLTKGLPLSSHPITNLFQYAFEIPLNHFNREDIFRLFSSDLIQKGFWEETPLNESISKIKGEYLFAQEDLPGIKALIRCEFGDGAESGWDIFLFDQVARKCGLNNLGPNLSGPRKRVLLRVKDYYQDQILHTLGARQKEGLLVEYYRFLAQINMLEERLILFESLANQSTPQGIADCFFQILDTSGFPENIVNLSEELAGLGPPKMRAMVKRDIKAYSILRDLILASANESRFAGELFKKEEGYGLLAGFYAIFKFRLNNSYLLDERNPNVIRVSEWLEIRGRSFDYVFAGGLTADKFPLREEANFIVPETPNKMFRMWDLMDQSKHLFSHLLRNYRKVAHLSYPRYTEEKEVQPSPVLVDLESMVKPHPSSEGGGNTLEEVFKWNNNPYFTSEEELLDATRVKDQTCEGVGEQFFPLKQMILKNDLVAENLIREVNALCSRWAMNGLFEYDGLVRGSMRFKEFLEAKSDIFSPSQLETLANCPMRYLFEYIYGLKTLEDLGTEVSPRDMGMHFHAILKLFFERIKNERKNVADIGLGRAFSIAKEVADHYLKGHSFLNKLEFFEFQKKEFLEGLDQSGFDSREGEEAGEGLFAQLLRFEEREFRDTIPAGVEYGFGQEGKPEVLLGKTRIQGFIDRYDMSKEREDMVCIYDYKTGKIPLSGTVKMGLSFQLPSYLLALKTVLQFKKVSAAFYALRKDVFLRENPLKQRINDHWEGAPGLDISGVRLIEEYVDHLIGLLENGTFHHSADEMICPYCEFKYACYRDMRRINHLLDSDGDHPIYSGKKNLEKWIEVDEFRKKWKAISRSMQQAFNLKTNAGRKKHFESVMEYGDWLRDRGDSLPFHREYIQELLAKIDDFEKKYPSLTLS
ncbi:MAG: PD-(D/E)XK nuclease family protein [Desulfatiglandales bacterium]